MELHLTFFFGGSDGLMLLHVLLKELLLLLVSNSESSFSMQSTFELELSTGSWPCMDVAPGISLTLSTANFNFIGNQVSMISSMHS